MQLTPDADEVMKIAETLAEGKSINIYHMMLAIDEFTRLKTGKSMTADMKCKMEKAANGEV